MLVPFKSLSQGTNLREHCSAVLVWSTRKKPIFKECPEDRLLIRIGWEIGLPTTDRHSRPLTAWLGLGWRCFIAARRRRRCGCRLDRLSREIFAWVTQNGSFRYTMHRPIRGDWPSVHPPWAPLHSRVPHVNHSLIRLGLGHPTADVYELCRFVGRLHDGCEYSRKCNYKSYDGCSFVCRLTTTTG